jgi:ubiquinone/menaquinone biosynthesis C-methylase UbiE
MIESQPGSRPRVAERSDTARLDFIEGARAFVTGQMAPAVTRRNREKLLPVYADPDKAPTDFAQVRALIDADPRARVGHRMMRSVQELIWDTTYDSLAKRRDELLAELDRTDALGPGSVEYDPNFRFPDYFTNCAFHLQKGGYDDPLAGYAYHLGGNVFRGGKNEDAHANRAIVDSLPLPDDGRVGKVLELACSAGMTSVQIKKRFPEAELWATDLSAGMVRYGHKYAREMGVDIHFKQMAAENITFPDNSFDLVFGHILLHELPTYAVRQAVAECYRVLRPGGVAAFSDIRDRTHVGHGVERALVEYETRWQAENNGEIYFTDFYESDLAETMRAAGFRDVNPSYAANAGVWAANLALPIRAGWK